MAAVDKLRLIEEVRRRPILWDCRIASKEKTRIRRRNHWADIAKALNSEVKRCRITWRKLRSQFCNEASRIPKRIKKAKENGEYGLRIQYCTWRYFEPLRFLLAGLSAQAQFDINLEHDSDFDQHSATKRFESYSFQDKSDNDIEMIESIDSDDTLSVPENVDESDDVEVIDNSNINHLQLQRRDCTKNSSLAKRSNNRCQINPINDCQDSKKREEAGFKSYTISLFDVIPERECTKISDSVSRKEFHFQAKEAPTKSNTIQACTEVNFCSTSPNFTTSFKTLDQLNPSTSSVSCFGSLDENDQGYRFLYSFLSQMKLMTDVQKLNFHENMKSSLLEICPEISSASILDRKLALPKYEDPDENFLYSFWPFTKSMSLSQNLLFRIKVIDLVHKIFSTETYK